MKVVTTAEMRQIEQAADASGLSYAEMMENAGRAVAEVVQHEVLRASSGSILTLCGPGNNGGDGLVAARRLAEWGHLVRVYCVKRTTQGDENRERAIRAGVAVLDEADDTDHVQLRVWLAEADVIIDALLGTGAALPVRDPIRSVLELAQKLVHDRRARRPHPFIKSGPYSAPITPISPTIETEHEASTPRPTIVAVDCPSGLHCDTGELDPVTLAADFTVTFACPKVGHFLFPGASAVGRLLVADIAIPPQLTANIAVELATPEMTRAWLPKRPPNAHKGTFGRALIIAGSVNYTGAAYLAGAAATRVGAGLVTMAVPGLLHPVLAAALHETVWLALPHDMGVVVPDARQILDKRLTEHQALLIGPGLSQEKEAVAFVQDFLLGGRVKRRGRIGFLPQIEVTEGMGEERPPLPPTVIDADGLNALARLEDWSENLPRGCILTPHPGEMARLCRVSTQEVNADRLGVARRQAVQWEQVVLLKGAYTIVAAPDERAVILPFANPGLASGGTGDVLAGTIVGLLAQGLAPFEAAALGGYLHGLAGELARRTFGEAGMVAGDLLPRLPEAIRWLASGSSPRGGISSMSPLLGRKRPLTGPQQAQY
jgi:NAD(P)H-hydrate epimerase